MSRDEQITAVGSADGAFASVVDPFARLVALQHSGSAACTVVHRGQVVVDIAAGGQRTDDRHLLFSITKVATAAALWRAHELGALDLDEPLAETWPELRKPETAAITPRMVLQHRSGLASIDADLSLEDLEAGHDEAAIARQLPYWAPGTAHGYHAFAYGTLLRGHVRRRLGTSVRELVAAHVSGPLGIDLEIGTGDPARVLPLVPAPTPGRHVPVPPTGIPGSTTGRLQAARPGLLSDPRFLALELPGTNGIGSAHAVATLMEALLRPGALLDEGSLRGMTALRSRGRDATLGFPTAFGTGVQRPFPRLPMLGPHSFGHEAAGGSVAIADPDRELVVVVTTTEHPAVAGAGTTALALVPTILACAESAGPHRKESP